MVGRSIFRCLPRPIRPPRRASVRGRGSMPQRTVRGQSGFVAGRSRRVPRSPANLAAPPRNAIDVLSCLEGPRRLDPPRRPRLRVGPHHRGRPLQIVARRLALPHDLEGAVRLPTFLDGVLDLPNNLGRDPERFVTSVNRRRQHAVVAQRAVPGPLARPGAHQSAGSGASAPAPAETSSPPTGSARSRRRTAPRSTDR